MAFIADYVFDAALTTLDTEGDALYITSTEATTYTEAITTYALGSKTALSIGAPEAGDTSGRKVVVASFSDGSVTGTGRATHWAIVDVSETRLLATGALSASQAVTSGNTFSLAAFDIEINDPS